MNSEIEFPEFSKHARLVIAMKGLPCTGKSEIATLIGEWAKCPVLYIDHFLDALSLEKGYSYKSIPSSDEAKRINHLAVDALCKAAQHHLCYQSFGARSPCVVIKSRFFSTFEVDKLMKLVRNCRDQTELGRSRIITFLVIECQMKNEHRFRKRLKNVVRCYGHHDHQWYKAWSWKDIDNARIDFELDCDENHLLRSIKSLEKDGIYVRFIRIVLDPFDDLDWKPKETLGTLTPAFLNVIKYLLIDWYDDVPIKGSIANHLDEHDYVVVEFDKLRQYLAEKELKASISQDRTKYLCVTNSHRNCVFKPCNENDYYCGVCEERVVSTQPAYTCYFCTLTLHKSCAETFEISSSDLHIYQFLDIFPADPSSGHACKSCIEDGEGFSRECNSCVYQTLVKDIRFPIIVNHECHGEHVLSIQVIDYSHHLNLCKACGFSMQKIRYGCYICNLYYHLDCVFLPTEVGHEHGGHKHALKLMYSHDDVEQEESYWCDVCYEDMDPQFWFYSCKDCPYYVAHPRCIVGEERNYHY